MQKTYSLEDHLSGINGQTINLFQSLREKILALDENIREEAKAKYIAYKLATNFVDVELWNKQLKVYLNLKSGSLKDPERLADDVSKIGHWGNGDYRLIIRDEKDLDYAMSLVRQSYELNK